MRFVKIFLELELPFTPVILFLNWCKDHPRRRTAKEFDETYGMFYACHNPTKNFSYLAVLSHEIEDKKSFLECYVKPEDREEIEELLYSKK